MYMRIDKLQIELPKPTEPDPSAAAAVQELLGGRFGEMSTVMNYTYQSFNMRGRDKIKPFYDLVANIATEEQGLHRKLYRFSVDDYKDMAAIWRGPHPSGDGEVVDGSPEGGPLADLTAAPENYAPGYHPDELA